MTRRKQTPIRTIDAQCQIRQVIDVHDRGFIEALQRGSAPIWGRAACMRHSTV